MAHGPILIIAGTNRPAANALRIAHCLKALYDAAGEVAEVYSLADLPAAVFEPTAYAKKPEAFVPVQGKVLSAAGLHIVTPEYNGSFPGVLKYFIDLLKFPESFEAKPVAFVGEAAGLWGGLRAVEQLQMIFGYRNAHAYPDRVFIPAVHTKLNEAGQLTDASIDERLAKQCKGFAAYAKRFAS